MCKMSFPLINVRAKESDVMQVLPMAKVGTATMEKEYQNGEIVELTDVQETVSEEVCCGGKPALKSSPFEQPGYLLENFVRGFLIHSGRNTALVKTKLEFADHLGTVLARIGVNRDNYKVSPGLYGTGNPGGDSPVLVTANYKLSFDALRRELIGLDCWILVLDTCGINVWCAAGKKTFSTEELVSQVLKTDLAKKVHHRKLIVPQLGAAGVAAHTVKLQSGFRVVYGPVRAMDIPEFLKNDMQATAQMRQVTFTLKERFVLIPVEFYSLSRKIWWLFPLLFLISGIGPDIFSLENAVKRGLLGLAGLGVGTILGGALVPIILPWLPGRRFSLKGAVLGIAVTMGSMFFLPNVQTMDKISLVLAISAISSYLAMNFTGSTPFTSPSGVEKEMKLAIPLQITGIAGAVLLWLVGPFL